MDWDIIGPMSVAAIFIVTTGGVLLLRPISKRLGALLEVMAKERQIGASEDMQRLRDEVEQLRSRMELVEDRQDFTERLLESGEKPGG